MKGDLKSASVRQQRHRVGELPEVATTVLSLPVV